VKKKRKKKKRKRAGKYRGEILRWPEEAELATEICLIIERIGGKNRSKKKGTKAPTEKGRR